jgi:autotransporter adhesin
MGNTNFVGGGGQAVSTPGIAAQGAVGIGYQNRVVGQGSVAIGNTSSALAAGAVAFGDTAVANNAGDVALGSGSVTSAAVGTAGATIGGTNYSFAGTTPTRTVSVGTAGAERTITNVAAGRLNGGSTDAINGSQLFATNQQVTANTTAITNLTSSVTNGTVGPVQQTGAANQLALVAPGGTGAAPGAAQNLTNVADGAVNATSTDAVNGSQLFATNQQVATNTTDITNLGNTINNITTGGGIKYFHANSVLADSVATGTDSVAIGPVAAADNANGVAIGLNSHAISSGSIAIGQGAVTGDAGDLTRINQVAVGNNARATAQNSAAFGDGAVASGPQATALGSLASATGSNSVAVGRNSQAGNSGTAVGTTAQANGTRSTALGQNVQANVTDGTAVGYGTRVTAAGGLAIGTNAAANDANAVALGTGSTTAAAVGTAGTTVNGVAYAFAGTTPGSTVSIGAAGAERTITNVAAGRIDGSSTDAINGSQLFATNQAVDGLGTQVTQNTTDIANLDGRVTTVEGAITNITTGGGIKYFHANSVFADSQALGTDSVAIGPNAVANNAGDIALGSGSTTSAAVGTASALIGGNTYNFAGTTPLSTVSVGAVGAERTITNVAAGRLDGSSTDAVNGSQLFATNQQVTINTNDIAALDGRVTTVEGDVVNLGNSLTNLGNSLTNITGDTSTAYTDANGIGIRYARTNETGLAQTDAFAQGVGSTALGYQATAAAGNAVALGRGAQASIDGSLALGSGSVADRAIAPISGTIPTGIGFVPYNTTDATLLGAVSVGNATTSEYRQITNVADGTSAQDAVTLRQLQGAIGSVSVTPVLYFHANSTAVDSLAAGQESIAVGPTTVVNGDNGIGIGNGAVVQLTAPGGTAIGQNAQVSQADGIAFGTNSIANGIQSIAIGPGANASFSGSVALGAGATTAVGSRVGYTGYGLAAPQNSAGEVSVGSAGAERQLTNVAAGSAPTDAVNVSQLNQVAQNTATALGGGASYNSTTGAYTAPSYTVGGNTYNNIGDALGAQTTAVTNLDNRVTTVEGNVTNLGNSTAAGLGGGSTYDPTTGTVTTNLNVGGNNYSNVNDALQALNTTASAGWNIQANGGPSTNVPSNGTLNVTAGSNTVVTLTGNRLEVAMADNPTFTGVVNANGGLAVGANTSVNMGGNVVQNVAAGAVNATSTDAVNGSQLHPVQQQAQNSVQYDPGRNSVTLNPGGAAATLHNVAAGVAPTDAVNLQQLNDGLADTLASANAYTDTRLAGVEFDLSQVRRDANAGTAGALAAAGLPQAFEPGRGMLAFGAGTYQGQSAFALGLSRVMDDGKTVIKAGATYDTQKRVGANAGVGFQF